MSDDGVLYCHQRGQDPLPPTVIAVLQFLTLLYEEGKGYSSLNMSRCAISTLSLEKDTVGSHHLISKFLRGILNRRPALPKNTVTWDAFWTSWKHGHQLDVRLSDNWHWKLRCSYCCCQVTWLLDPNNITLSKNEVRWRIGDLIKTSNLKNHMDKLVFAAYCPDWRLCVVTYVKAYFNRTDLLQRKESGFLISFKKSHTTKYQGIQSGAGSKLLLSSLE